MTIEQLKHASRLLAEYEANQRRLALVSRAQSIRFDDGRDKYIVQLDTLHKGSVKEENSVFVELQHIEMKYLNAQIQALKKELEKLGVDMEEKTN